METLLELINSKTGQELEYTKESVKITIQKSIIRSIDLASVKLLQAKFVREAAKKFQRGREYADRTENVFASPSPP